MIKAVNKMKAYIFSHLGEQITAKSVADSAGYSQYHASRIFKAETGLPPFEFIRRERLATSARTLRGGNFKVLDVALDFAFDSHEGFALRMTFLLP